MLRPLVFLYSCPPVVCCIYAVNRAKRKVFFPSSPARTFVTHANDKERKKERKRGLSLELNPTRKKIKRGRTFRLWLQILLSVRGTFCDLFPCSHRSRPLFYCLCHFRRDFDHLRLLSIHPPNLPRISLFLSLPVSTAQLLGGVMSSGYLPPTFFCCQLPVQPNSLQ